MNKKKLTIIIMLSIAILTGSYFVAANYGFFSGGTNAPSVPEDTMTRGLVGYWEFDEGTGSTAYDASGNGNNGTLTNGPKWTAGKSGSALQFDGVDDYVDCGESIVVENTDLTLSAWIYVNDLSADERAIIAKYDSTANSERSFLFRVETGGALSFFTHDGVTQTYKRTALDSVSIETWYHIAVVYDDSANDATIYVNSIPIPNSLQDDTLTNIQDTTTNITIGSWASANDRMDGSIDSVRIYNRALSAEEVKYHYNRGGPVASWNFDEGSGTVIHDSSGNGFDGTLNE